MGSFWRYISRGETVGLGIVGGVFGLCGYGVHWSGWVLFGVVSVLMVVEYFFWWQVVGGAEDAERRAEVAGWEWVASAGGTKKEAGVWLNELRECGGVEFCRRKGVAEVDWPVVRDDGRILSGMYAGGFYAGAGGVGEYAYGGMLDGGEVGALPRVTQSMGLEVSVYEQGIAKGMGGGCEGSGGSSSTCFND